MIISDKVFNFIRDCAEIIPLLGTLYLGIATIWNLPFAEEVMKTCTCLAGFLGGLTQVFRHNYNKDTYTPSEEEIAE